jgi:putative DNA primase/helicase
VIALRELARALGGDIVGGQVSAPGPSHGPRDRSLSVRLSSTAPLGFIVFSHAGDPFEICQTYVAVRLGLDADAWKNRERGEDRPKGSPRHTDGQRRPSSPAVHRDDHADKTAAAMALWSASVDPRGTTAETYLNSRSLELDADVAGEVIRWHPGINALVALFRSVESNLPQAVSRTFLDGAGKKIGRKFLGLVAGAAIMLDGSEEVTHGLHVGEGIETCLAARVLGLRPTWALGSASAIAAFPILSAVECITLLREHDDASMRATEQCAARWHTAGRNVVINESTMGSDLNDAIRRRA